MKNQRIGVVVGVVCSILVAGCASEAEPTVDSQVADKSPPQVSGKALGSSAASSIPTNVVRLFSRMDSIGPGSQEAYDKELKEFQASAEPVATLAAVYAQLPASARAARWKAVHAAGQISAPESVDFLQQVALSPAQIDPTLRGHDAGDQSFRVRYTASVGVVNHYVNGVAGAEAAVERMLKEADIEIARLVGVELFSVGKLTDAWRQILSGRGVSTNFRQLGEAELNDLRTVDPSRDGHQGADTRARARAVSVPALRVGE